MLCKFPRWCLSPNNLVARHQPIFYLSKLVIFLLGREILLAIPVVQRSSYGCESRVRLPQLLLEVVSLEFFEIPLLPDFYVKRITVSYQFA